MLHRPLRVAAVAALAGGALLGCGDDGPTMPESAPLPELFGDRIYRADGSPVDVGALDGTALIGIYFASAGCGACGAFTPLLMDAYDRMKEDGRSFEVVLVTLGISEEALFQYMTESGMPWMAVSSQSPQANDLVQRYDVRWVPTLVVIDHAGRTVSMNGRDEVVALGAAAYDSWSAGG